MRLKPFKIFESNDNDELKSLLNEVLVELIDEYDPNFDLNYFYSQLDNKLANSARLYFQFEFDNQVLTHSNAHQLKEFIEFNQQVTNILGIFHTIMKKLAHSGYANTVTTRNTSSKNNFGVELIISKKGVEITGLDWIYKGDEAVKIDCQLLDKYLSGYAQKLEEVTMEPDDDEGYWVWISYSGLGYAGEDMTPKNMIQVENEILKFEYVDSVTFNNRQIELFVAIDTEIIDTSGDIYTR